MGFIEPTVFKILLNSKDGFKGVPGLFWLPTSLGVCGIKNAAIDGFCCTIYALIAGNYTPNI